MTNIPQGKMVRLKSADGVEFNCWLEPARGVRKGGVVILQEIFGVTDQLKSVAAHYAALGYETAVPALFDRQRPDTVLPFDNGAVGRDLMNASVLDDTMKDVATTVAMLAENGGKVGVIGFCWGGGLAIRAAQDLDIGAAVAFYGTKLPLYLDRPLKAPLQGHYGVRDTHVPAEMLKQATDYFPDFDVYTYEAGHAFANDGRPADYVADAAEAAHARTLELFRSHVG